MKLANLSDTHGLLRPPVAEYFKGVAGVFQRRGC